jgi:O-antigen/teichoic acid export membrane protein
MKKNVVLTVSAQLVSFFVSAILNLILPKYISEMDYSSWQTLLLYLGYVPIFHFGFLDGLMLRYSQYDYQTLNKPLVQSQFRLFLGAEVIFALIVFALSFGVENETYRQLVRFISFGIITANLYAYASHLFQMTNRISKYVIFVMMMRLMLGVGIVVALICGANSFYDLCVVYFASCVLTILWGASQNKGLFLGTGRLADGTVAELKSNVSSGIMLLIANLSSLFFVGGAKMVVQWHYDPLLFGKVAFSFTLVNLFLTFVTAASVGIFPSLKRIDTADLPDFYVRIRRSMTPLLFVSLLLYFPGCYVLKLWLPNYVDSLVYLSILLPMIVYESRVTLLTNNYLKTYRKERLMLIVNLVSVAIAFVLFLVSAYILDSLFILLACLVLVSFVRSVVSEIVVMRIINRRCFVSFGVELSFVVLFYFAVLILNG